ncbi:MAG: hypothetical protein KDI36_12955 [Pseudomonadales bacterium]|nr:hypothetical protein [Pseudomonadales bacterium]
MKNLLFLLAFLLSPLLSAAEQELPEALKDADPQTLMGVGFGMMNLTEEEKAEFGAIIGKFNKDTGTRIAKELKKKAADAPRRIRKVLKNNFEDLDEATSHLVTADRRNGYLIFKKGLADQFSPPKR